MGTGVANQLEPYGDNYFAFVLIGVAFTDYLSVSIGSFPGQIRSVQMMGTLEALLVTPTSVASIFFSSTLYNFTFTSVRVVLYLVIGVIVFGLNLKLSSLPAFVVVLVLTILSFSGIGLLSAAFIIVFKQGSPISWMTGVASGLLGGVFGNVYGPRSKYKTSVMAEFFKRAFEGLSFEIYGDGMQTRDFIFIEDLCNAIYLSLKSLELSNQSSIQSPNSVAGEVFQIATFKETTINEIAAKVKEIVERENGKKVDIVYAVKRPGDVQRNYSDISKAMDLLGFNPNYDLDTGLYRTWKAFRLEKTVAS